MITRVGVVVPARDEEQLLPRCLDALEVAIARLTDERRLPVSTVLVLDRCADATQAVAAARPWVTTVSVDAGRVGVARAAGCAAVMLDHGGERPDALWLASTDADSQVPADWLTRQIELADGGAEVVLGTVTVDDWSDHPAAVARQWQSSYDASDGHPHVHGANVGCRADRYLEAGGFVALTCDEDVTLVTDLADLTDLAGRAIVSTGAIPVVTSARPKSRVNGGFATFLARLG